MSKDKSAKRGPSRQDLKEAWEYVNQIGNVVQAAKTFRGGMKRSTLNEWYSAAIDLFGESKTAGQNKQGPIPSEKFEDGGDDDSRHIHSVSKSIRTLDDAMLEAKVDTVIWEVDRYVINKWDVGMKLKSNGEHKVRVEQLWQVKIWLRRRVSKPIEDAIAALADRLKRWAPKYPSAPVVKKRNDPCMLEFAPVDAHFGKLLWGSDGTKDHLREAETILLHAADDVLARTRTLSVERVMIPFGNDFLHVDNDKNETAHGTRQDVSAHYSRIIEVAEAAMIKVIERFSSVAPVDIIWVPGNHDPHASYAIARVLRAWFHRTPAVNVDVGPSPRKYYAYGKNLIGLAHGNEEKHRDLPSIMADEVPDLWAASIFREFQVGHDHRSRKTEFRTTDTFGSTLVRTLLSIAGTDAWHHRKGYVKTPRAAESFVWSPERGLESAMVSPVLVG